MYQCDAVASVPSVVQLLPRSAVLKTFATEPDVAEAFMATLARQVMTLRTRPENRNLRTARERVLHYLGLQASDPERVVRLNRDLKTMASELGLTHESLYRTPASLEAEGVIQRAKGESVCRPCDRDHTGRAGTQTITLTSATVEFSNYVPYRPVCLRKCRAKSLMRHRVICAIG